MIRDLLVTLKLFLNAKSSLSLWSQLAFGHEKWFLNTNLCLIKTFLITKFDCTIKFLGRHFHNWKSLLEWMINLRNCDKLSVHFSRLIVNCYLDFLWIFWTFSIYIWYIVDRTLLRQASQVTVAFTSFGFWRTAWMHKVSCLTALELTEGQPGRALFI